MFDEEKSPARPADDRIPEPTPDYDKVIKGGGKAGGKQGADRD